SMERSLPVRMLDSSVLRYSGWKSSRWNLRIRYIRMNTDLQGRVVVITGASGAIGAAIARQFALEGAKLVLHYRQGRKNVEALQRELRSTESIAVRADLTREADARGLFALT